MLCAAWLARTLSLSDMLSLFFPLAVSSSICLSLSLARSLAHCTHVAAADSTKCAYVYKQLPLCLCLCPPPLPACVCVCAAGHTYIGDNVKWACDDSTRRDSTTTQRRRRRRRQATSLCTVVKGLLGELTALPASLLLFHMCPHSLPPTPALPCTSSAHYKPREIFICCSLLPLLLRRQRQQRLHELVSKVYTHTHTHMRKVLQLKMRRYGRARWSKRKFTNVRTSRVCACMCKLSAAALGGERGEGGIRIVRRSSNKTRSCM